MYLSLLNLIFCKMKTISNTHPLDFHYRRTNNPPCIICKRLIELTIKGRFFKVRSPIEIPSTPCSGIGKLILLTGYSSRLTWFTWSRWIYNCIKISLTKIGWPPLFICCSVLAVHMKCELFDGVMCWFICDIRKY